jgi:hypothetical protein
MSVGPAVIAGVREGQYLAPLSGRCSSEFRDR